VDAQAGLKDISLFERGVKSAWNWAKPSEWIRWFTDGERPYGKALWKLVRVYLPPSETTEAYRYRKVWQDGLEVAINVKGSQGTLHVEWIRQARAVSGTAEMDEASGSGWLQLSSNEEVEGLIKFHGGDRFTFKARKAS
jgi:hypothetical protein